MNKLGQLYQLVVVGKEKAIVAFVVTAVGAYVAKHGVTLDMTLKDALTAVLYGVVGHVAVYLKANS